MTLFVSVAAAILIIAIIAVIDRKKTRIAEEPEYMETPAPKPEIIAEAEQGNGLAEWTEKDNHALIKEIKRWDEEQRSIHKWRQFTRHAKKARTRKKYQKRLDRYYQDHPIYSPSGMTSGNRIDSIAGCWWRRSPSTSIEHFSMHGPRSGQGGGSK